MEMCPREVYKRDFYEGNDFKSVFQNNVHFFKKHYLHIMFTENRFCLFVLWCDISINIYIYNILIFICII